MREASISETAMDTGTHAFVLFKRFRKDVSTKAWELP